MPRPIPALAFDSLELYAAGIDTSDYVRCVAPLITRRVPNIGDLLDIGAGGGQLGLALRTPGACWTAIEPASVMRVRLARFSEPPRVLACDWEKADVVAGGHDTVLAANIPPTLERPEVFLARCKSWARQTVIWVVPAQMGPRGLCLAGCLPSTWHGEDETPGVDIVLRGLSSSDQPQEVALTDWTFSAVVSNVESIAAYLADRLGWPEGDLRRPQMIAHLAAKARPHASGFRFDVARRSAILVWRL